MNQSDLFKIITNHKGKNLPFVVFNEPYSDEIHAKLQIDDILHTECDLSSGAFVFAPFDSKKFNKIYMPFDKCKSYKSLSSNKVIRSNFDSKNSDDILNKKTHIKLIKKSLTAIKNGVLKKVVLSRTELMSISSVDLALVFKKTAFFL